MKAAPKIHCFAATLALLLAMSSGAIAQAENPFVKGNQEYAAGRFKEAIEQYEKLVQSREWSPSLFYNIGNAWFRAGDFGRAILNYERALSLDPHHPEAKANLRVARDEARALVLVQSDTERYLSFLSVNQWAVIASITFWFGAFCLAYRGRSTRTIVLSAISLIIVGLSIVAVQQLEKGTRGRDVAVVQGNEIEARVATAETASRVLVLPAGSEIKIESRRGDWLYATLPGNLRGWIPAKSAESIRL